MLLRLRQALIITSLLLVQAGAFAQSASICEDFFGPRTFSFVELQHYRVFLRGENEIISAVYVGDAPSGQPIFDDGRKARTVERDTIIDAVEVPRATLTSQIKNAIQSRVITAQKMTNLMLKPLRKIATGNEQIEVVGTLRTSKGVGGKIFDSLTRFDAHMAALGFKTPEKTRVIVADRPLLPDMLGPFSMNIPFFSFWRGGKPLPIISMAPLANRAAAVRDESVLLHERTHSLLSATYRLDAFINRSATVQEALADFAAIHFLDQPTFAPELGGDGKPLRDIGSRTISRGGQSAVRDVIMKSVDNDYHANSIFISHLLWRVREAIGPEKMSELFRPLVENMNSYYGSYAAKIAAERAGTDDDIVHLSQDIEYSLAVVERTAADLNDDTLFAVVAKVARNYAEELQFSSDRIDTLSRILRKEPGANQPPEAHNKRDMMDAIVMHAYGVAGFVADASFVYWLGSFFH